MAEFDAFINQFRGIQPKFSRIYTRLLNQAGLTLPQYTLLLELLQAAPEPMTMTAISQKLYITKPAVTSLTDRLEKHGLLKRLDHPEDRRISLLEIQPKGKKVVRQIQELFLEIFLQTMKRFSKEERATVQKFYGTLSRTIDGHLTSAKKDKG